MSEIDDIIAGATVPSELNPESAAPPTIEEIALRLSELRNAHEDLSAKLSKLAAALGVRDI